MSKKTPANPQKPLPEADIYVRISSADDTRGVERLVKECLETAARVGWHVPPDRIFIDNDISASRYSRKPRPGYDAVLQRIASGVTARLITWHTDRMHRRPAELEAFIDLVEDHHVDIEASRIGRIDLTTPSGRLMARQLGAYAAFESEHKSDRLKSKHREIAENGGWKGGIRCFGYEPDGMTVRESEAAEVQRLAEAVIHGQSLRSLALELNQRGVTTVTGKRWTSAHLRTMLVRSRLAGLREHQGKIVNSKAAWPAILDRPTWEACKTVLEDPARCTGGGGRRGRVPTSLGTGLYVCGVCDQPRLRLGRSNGRRAVYRCGNTATSPSQGHVSRVAASLDAYVEGALLELLSRPGAVEAMCQVVDTDDAELAALACEQATIRPRLNKAAQRYNAGDIDDEQLAIISKELRGRDAEITAVLTAARMRSPLDVLLGAESIADMWDTVLAMGQKRAILSEVLVVTVKSAPGGGRAPDGSYFNTDSIDIVLTEQARARLRPRRRRRVPR